MKGILLISLILLLSINVSAQISPGELTNDHSKLEGMSNCTNCHVIGAQVNNSKCLDCHTEIKQSVSSGHGFHSSDKVRGKNCWNCHSEHHGRNFNIIKFDKNSFDHSSTGFELTGKHSKAQCVDCHQSKNISNDGLKKKNKTYLGLSTKCVSCHEDNHLGALGDNCLKCHNISAFKPAAEFDHNQSKFRLTNAHLKVTCTQCHKPESRNGRNFQKFTSLGFANCSPCHKDIHQDKFGRDCQKCHVTTSFKTVNKQNFDHDKTDFKLLGRHESLNCNECHKKGFTVKIAFGKCYDCHKDYHKGEFIRNGIQRDCKDCHTNNAFKPSTYTIEEHSKLKFALQGNHLATSCQSCHLKDNNMKFLFASSKCIDCHKNIHGNEISARYINDNRCENCHNEKSWLVSNFDHKQTNFELTDKHATAKCKACHYNESDKQFRFASLRPACESCHRDVHQGQFNNGSVADCRRCHTTKDWHPSKFNHELTRFPLTGGHSDVKCVKCHPVSESAGFAYTKYKIPDFKCSNCHSTK
ncbi:MAG: cytochrome C [Ignavibacteria bacterium]